MPDKYVPALDEKLHFECTMCGNCCRNHLIPVTLQKAVEIAFKTGRSLNNIVFTFKQDAGGIDHYYMSLKRKADENGAKCLFLNNNLCELHRIDPKLKPENCKHVPYNLVTKEEISSWTDEERKKCLHKAVVLDMKKDVYAAVLDSCPGVGKGAKINIDTLKKEMTLNEEELVKTSEAIKNRHVPILPKDREMSGWGKMILTGNGRHIKKSGISFIVYPKGYAEKIDCSKICKCIDSASMKNLASKTGIFRFSILDNGEKGMALGLLGDFTEKQISEKAGQKGVLHQHGVYNIGNNECFLLV